MARIRSVKPDFFKHYDLYKAEEDRKLPLRIAFSGLWCVADREGRFKWKPMELKVDILPYDPVDFSSVLDALQQTGFIQKYTVGGKDYGLIPSFTEHQRIRNDEAQSCIPSPSPEIVTDPSLCSDESTPWKGKEGKGKEGKEPNGIGDISTGSVKEGTTESPPPSPAPPPPQAIMPFTSQLFAESWQTWKDFRKRDIRKPYKTVEAEQAALKHLNKLSGGNEKTAVAIIEQSIGNTWQGLFELKNNGNGTIRKQTTADSINAVDAAFANLQRNLDEAMRGGGQDQGY